MSNIVLEHQNNYIYENSNYNYDNFFSYLFKYFRSFSKEGFITEYNLCYYSKKIKNKEDLRFINLFMLPKELICLTQSKTVLNILRDIIAYNKTNKCEEVKIIEDIIIRLQKGLIIDKIRKYHINILISE